MFITIQVSNKVRSINADYITIIEEVASNGGTIYKYRLIDGGEFTIDKDNYDTLMAELVICESQIPTSSQAKPSELGTLLNELHKLLGGRGEAKMTTDRKARLTTRLKDFSPEEMKLAATNLGLDEFMQGANDNGKRYGTIDYLLRTSANVNKWIEDQPEKPKKSMF